MSNIIQNIHNTNGDTIYPVTKTDAVYDDLGKRLSDTINEVKQSITDVNNSLTSKIIVEQRQVHYELAINTYSDNQVDISKENYQAIGIVGFASNSLGAAWLRCDIVDRHIIAMTVQNVGNTPISATANINVLYSKL